MCVNFYGWPSIYYLIGTLKGTEKKSMKLQSDHEKQNDAY